MTSRGFRNGYGRRVRFLFLYILLLVSLIAFHFSGLFARSKKIIGLLNQRVIKFSCRSMTGDESVRQATRIVGELKPLVHLGYSGTVHRSCASDERCYADYCVTESTIKSAMVDCFSRLMTSLQGKRSH